MQVLIQSFGFKYGLPSNADFVFDVRCLPNPYWKPELRLFTGLDQPVKDYLQHEAVVNRMITDLTEFVATWGPKFQEHKRGYLTIAIGCTGGMHRSVYVAEQLAVALKQVLGNVEISHREIKI